MKQENIVSINMKIHGVKLLQKPKRGIFRTNLADMKGKKTWKTIDNALYRKPRKAIPDAISVNTKLSTNKQEIANEFNKYLATICANNHTPTTNRSYKSYLRTRPRSNLTLN